MAGLEAIVLGATGVATFVGTFLNVVKSKSSNGQYEIPKEEMITLIYNKKRSTAGILVGGINEVRGRVYGASVGGINNVADNIYGVSLGLWNVIDEQIMGVELGVVNLGNNTGLNYALQGGVLNWVEKIKNSVQLGFLNKAEKTEGFYLQIGLWNENDKRNSFGINTGYSGKPKSYSAPEPAKVACS